MLTDRQKNNFHRKYERGDGCWEWTGARFESGYGKVSLNAKHYLAHRIAWVLDRGFPIPERKMIRHICHNRSCVRPDHLCCGTAADNNHDTIAAGNARPFGRKF